MRHSTACPALYENDASSIDFYDQESLLHQLPSIQEQAFANPFSRIGGERRSEKVIAGCKTRAGSDGPLHIEQMFEELNTAHGVDGATLSKVKNYVAVYVPRREGILSVKGPVGGSKGIPFR